MKVGWDLKATWKWINAYRPSDGTVICKLDGRSSLPFKTILREFIAMWYKLNATKFKSPPPPGTQSSMSSISSMFGSVISFMSDFFFYIIHISLFLFMNGDDEDKEEIKEKED